MMTLIKGRHNTMHCMAHARRKFSDALQNDRARAEYALSMFQKLYAIERTIKDEALSEAPYFS